MRIAAALVIVAAAACHHGPDQEQLEHDATAAMADYTSSLRQDGPGIQDALKQLAADAGVAPDQVPGDLHDRVLPSLDRLIAAGDRAVSASDAFVATGVDLPEHITTLLKQMHDRNGTMHRLRDRLGAIKAPITEAEQDEIEKALVGTGMMLMMQ